MNLTISQIKPGRCPKCSHCCSEKHVDLFLKEWERLRDRVVQEAKDYFGSVDRDDTDLLITSTGELLVYENYQRKVPIMGVDFYSCHRCGDTFPDCGNYEECECGIRWDSDYCASEEGFITSELDEDGNRETSCDFCRGESAEDAELLQYALEKLGLSRNDLEEEYLSD
jgi:hypothetical protein